MRNVGTEMEGYLTCIKNNNQYTKNVGFLKQAVPLQASAKNY